MSEKYNLIVVDDEFVIRDGLLSFHWDKLGYKAIGSAANGQEALAIMENKNIDIVVTDVKMPVMDGLELSRIIKAKYPDCKIIILTGYKEFDYAKAAISAGVYDYILKPVNMNRLEALLERLKGDLDKERESAILFSTYKKQVKLSIPIAREFFFKSIIEKSDFDIEDIQEKLDLLEMHLDKRYFSCCIFKINSSFDLLNNKIKSTCEQLLKKYFESEVKGFYFFTGSYEIICILNFQPANSYLPAHSYLLSLLGRIHSDLIKISDWDKSIRIHAGAGNIYNNIQSLKKSYLEAKKSTEQKFFNPDKSIFFIWNKNMKIVGDSGEYPYKAENRLITVIFEGGKEQIVKSLDKFWNEAIKVSNKNNRQSFQKNILQLLNMLERKLKKLGLDIEDICSIKHSYNDVVFEIDSHIKLKKYIQEILFQCFEAVSKFQNKQMSSCHLAIQKAIDYIKKNYNRKINQKEVANHVYLNTSYFSLQFKKDTGKNFIDYLTQYRMKKAKELLDNVDLKVYEVGQMVGYNDPKYFTESFKKNFSLTPMQYRNKIIKNL